MAESPLKAMKDFFSTPDKPVTNEELIDFKKNDPDGYAQVRDGILNGSLNY